jgi:hypothetical protein
MLSWNGQEADWRSADDATGAPATCERRVNTPQMCRLNFPPGELTARWSLGAVGDGWPMMVPFTQRGASLVRLGEIAMILELHRQGVSVSVIARQVGSTARRCTSTSSAAWSRRRMARARGG